MKYYEARPLIRSGDLLAWSHRGIHLRTWWYDFKVMMVRAFTRSEYSHVAVAWVIGERVFVLEAVSAEVRMFPLSRLLPCYWMPMHAEWTEEAEACALEPLGQSYAPTWRMVLEYLRLVNTKTTDAFWQCAEYFQMVLAHCNIVLSGRLEPTRMVQAGFERGGQLTMIELPEVKGT